jgi:DNA helicase-2/ATP-dependent DNA helicase PcrA
MSGQSFFLMKEAKVLFGYLRVMASRADKDAFKACVMNPSRRLGNAFIEKVAETHDMVKRDWIASVTKALSKLEPYQARIAREWLQLIKEFQADAVEKPPAEVLGMLREKLKLDEFFNRNGEDGEDTRSSDSMDALATFARSFSTCTEMLDVIENVEHHRAASSGKQNAVTISTVHKAKGGEWPVVYVIQVGSGLFPVSSADLHEERRCFYVAITRAEDELWISRPAKGQKADGEEYQVNPSCFLKEAGLDEEESGAYHMGKRVDPMRVGTQVGLLI